MKTLALILIAGALPAGEAWALTGPYDEPYALIQSARRAQARQVEPAALISIDQRAVRPLRAQPIAPGTHVVEVSMPGRGPGVSSTIQRRTITIEARACTRYYLGARRLEGSRDYEVFVDLEEPIGECAAKFARR